MLDLAMDIYRELHANSAVPSSMSARRDEVVANMSALREDVAPILAVVADPGRVAELKAERCFNLAFLSQTLNISSAHVEVLQRYAKFTYECGDYSTAAQLLSHYRLLTPDADKSFSALWGKLACEILTANWEPALEDVNAIRDLIDSRTATPPAMQLQQRSWLMHWALFLLGNHPSGKTIVADLFFQDKYLNALQTNCAHLLRYLAVAVVTNPRRRGLLKELVRTIGLERHQHSDAVTLFLEDLYVRCDFEAAQARLADCAKLLDSDFFLSNQEEEFLKHAR